MFDRFGDFLLCKLSGQKAFVWLSVGASGFSCCFARIPFIQSRPCEFQKFKISFPMLATTSELCHCCHLPNKIPDLKQYFELQSCRKIAKVIHTNFNILFAQMYYF